MSFSRNLLPAAVVAGATLIIFLIWSRSVRKSPYRLPPTPPTNSIWGHRTPERNPFFTYASWIEQHGPLISLREGMSHYVVIGRHKAAIEIMERQGALLVDRPRFVAAGEMLSRGLRMIAVPAGERLKRMRRILHTHLQPKAAQTYEPLQSFHAKRLILSLLESPERYEAHARTYAATIILKITYGKDTPTHGSQPDVTKIRKSLKRLRSSMRPGAYLVDNLPWLKYLPFYGRDLRQGFIEDYELFHRLLNGVKSRMHDDDSGPSFVKFLLSREVDFSMNETEMAFLAGSLFGAGALTTAFAISIAMTAAARHPDAQAAVHAELEAVVGKGRLPTFDDEKCLPVLQAFILESSRWRPLVPLGFPHRATEDIVWGDYYIPAGTTVFGNHWAISRDPEVFPDPEIFNLKRWLTSDGKVRDDLKFPYFGFGRRVCPGQHIAVRSIYMNMALVLWSFHITIDESRPNDDLAFLNVVSRDFQPVGLVFEPRVSKETLMMMMSE